ncbi:hypothetical protein SAMD00019534_094340, partial [Acytostelium subglobosum LB1]|uniref:hypothetical protein n=1 Tax=Acytostelium subglobosum LB1 TaxID=1410327 RepID=UPI000644EB12
MNPGTYLPLHLINDTFGNARVPIPCTNITFEPSTLPSSSKYDVVMDFSASPNILFVDGMATYPNCITNVKINNIKLIDVSVRSNGYGLSVELNNVSFTSVTPSVYYTPIMMTTYENLPSSNISRPSLIMNGGEISNHNLSATILGGIVWTLFYDVTINNVKFTNNIVNTIILTNTAHTLITGSTFTNNTFDEEMISVKGSDSNNQTIITNCTFNQNVARVDPRYSYHNTAIVSNFLSQLHLTDSIFDGNINASFVVSSRGPAYIERMTVTNNTVRNDGRLVALYNSKNATMINSTLSGNTLVDSFVVELSSSKVTLTNVVFDKNRVTSSNSTLPTPDSSLIQCSGGSITFNNVVNNAGVNLMNCKIESRCSVYGDHSDICKSKDLSTGAIVGIVIGVVAGVAIIVAVLAVVIVRRRRTRNN